MSVLFLRKMSLSRNDIDNKRPNSAVDLCWRFTDLLGTQCLKQSLSVLGILWSWESTDTRALGYTMCAYTQ